MIVALLLSGLALAERVTAQSPPTLATPGAPPDVVGLYEDVNYVGSTSIASVFSYSSAASTTNAPYGVYLSHTCNSDGSFDAVWSVDVLSSNGSSVTSQTFFCEHGSVNLNGTYSSIFQQTTMCPLTSYAAASSRNLTELSQSNLGALLGTPFCNPALVGSSLVHANAATPVLAPGPDSLLTDAPVGGVGADGSTGVR